MRARGLGRDAPPEWFVQRKAREAEAAKLAEAKLQEIAEAKVTLKALYRRIKKAGSSGAGYGDPGHYLDRAKGCAGLALNETKSGSSQWKVDFDRLMADAETNLKLGLSKMESLQRHVDDVERRT